MQKLKDAEIGLADTDENFAVIVLGRRVSLDSLEDLEVTRRKLGAIVETVKTWAQTSGLPLCYVHMGTTVNWDEDDDAIIDEGADAVIGVALAVGVYPGEPVRVSTATLQKVSEEQIPEAFWAELQNSHGLILVDPGLYLAPAGWTVAELWGPEAKYDADDEYFDEGQEPLVVTCAADFPPGVALDVSSLPETVQLRATYA